MATLLSIILGGSIGLLAGLGGTMNILVMIVIIRGSFLNSNDNALYPMVFNLLISDTVHLALILFYLVPSSILQNELYPGLGENLGFLMLWVLFVSWMMIDLLAICRFVRICYPKLSWLFEKRNMIKFCFLVWPVCGLFAATGQFIVPCCELVIYYRTYSLHFGAHGNATNYADFFVEKPISVGTSLITTFCYTMIFIKMRKGRRLVGDSLSERAQLSRRRKEYGFALQYSAIAFCATLTWVSFVIYPLIIPLDQPQWFAAVVIGMILNSSISALVYIFFNHDLHNALMVYVFKRHATASNTTLTVPISNSHNSYRIRNSVPQAEEIIVASTN